MALVVGASRMGYIRRLEVKGFKSFGPRPVTINFEPGFTVVTGPNGSGKSNIADAILFALGENSPRTLRAAQGRLVGVIYDPKKEPASEQAPEDRPLSCRVTLQIDNNDRKIPLDSSQVTITRELRKDSESSYYLNGRKSTKTVIADLLEVSGLSPGGLNIIPQNAPTRVADLTPDEKRKMIEEIIGIARFEEKKIEAQKQLASADTKLQIELARTGEMKTQIEKLEVQRNDLLRFGQLESQVNWLRAVQTSRKVVELRQKLASLKKVEEETAMRLEAARKKKDEFEARMTSAQTEKDKFILEIIQGGGPGPTAVRSEMESSKFRLERLFSETQAREQNVTRLETETIPSLRTIILDKKRQTASAQSTVDTIFENEQKLEARRRETSIQVDEVRKAEETLRGTLERKRRELDRIEQKLQELRLSLAAIDLEANGINANLGVEKKRLDELAERGSGFSQVLEQLDSNAGQLFELLEKATEELGGIETNLNKMEKNREAISESIGVAGGTLEKVMGEISFQAAKRALSKEIATEREEQTRLHDLCERGGVAGYLGRLSDLISFPNRLRTAVSIVLDRWTNAFVVEDMRSMTAFIKTARRLNIKSLAVIPLSEVERTPAVRVGASTGVIGPLASVIKAEKRYQGLINFVAGDAILVETEAVGYMLAAEGFRTVTPKGEIFDLGGRAFTFGYHDIFANILQGLEDIEDVEEIENALQSLKGAISKRKQQLLTIENDARSLGKDRVKKIVSVAALKAEVETVSRLSKRYKGIFRSMNQDHLNQQRVVERLSKKFASLTEKEASIEKGIFSLTKAAEEIKSLELERILAELEASREDFTLRVNEVSSKLAEVHLTYSREKADLEQMLLPSYEKIKQDLEAAESQFAEDKAFVSNAKKEVQELAKKVTELETQLQKILEASANSRPVIEEYESKLRRLKQERDSTERTVSTVEREVFSVQQGASTTQDKIEQALSSLRFWGYESVLEIFEGSDQLLSQLEMEYEELARSVNKVAEREYEVVYDNYRNLSTRINELEQERNSIVRFIESVDSEKKKVFASSFETINSEFGAIFKRLTGGTAFLELEKPDDIFSGGLYMMASFRGKPAWESSSMSGGEKSVTAVSLILAIQKVNPHPFYLFDEIDQNLDMANTSSLAAFLRERSNEAQIITITLKADMVAESNVSYGVYSVGGVSRFVKTNLEVQVKGG